MSDRELTQQEVMEEMAKRAETFDSATATCFHAGMTKEEILKKFNRMIDTAKKARQ
jgi:predicted secreted Zn-dependent protease